MTPKVIDDLRELRQDLLGVKPQITFSKRHIMIGGLILGMVIAITVTAILSVSAVLNGYQTEQIKKNQDAIDRIEALENPAPRTPLENQKRIEAAIKICAETPHCRMMLIEALTEDDVGG